MGDCSRAVPCVVAIAPLCPATLVRHENRLVLWNIRISLYSGNTLRSPIEAPLISREVLPETYFLSVIMAADAQAWPFLQFQASCSCGTL
jgi:hypothetical protein